MKIQKITNYTKDGTLPFGHQNSRFKFSQTSDPRQRFDILRSSLRTPLYIWDTNQCYDFQNKTPNRD